MPGIAMDGSEDLPNDDIKSCGACANGCIAGCQLEKDSPPSSITPPPSAASVVFRTEKPSLAEFSVDVEKMLCGLLGRDWSAGMSISDLAQDLQSKIKVLSAKEFLGLPVGLAAERLAEAIDKMGKDVGMIRREAGLSGPQLVMVCSDLSEYARTQDGLLTNLRDELNALSGRTDNGVTDTELYSRIQDQFARYPIEGADCHLKVVNLIAENETRKFNAHSSVSATIQAEKQLCEALGVDWTPQTNMATLCQMVAGLNAKPPVECGLVDALLGGA